MRTFEIFYPELGTFDFISVIVEPGELPEMAIEREGDAISERILVGGTV